MRVTAATLIVLISLPVMVWMLMQKSTVVWQLILVGSFAGLLAGSIGWGRQGAVIGFVAGSVIGLAAPVLYTPFWFFFTLPPHPEVDF